MSFSYYGTKKRIVKKYPKPIHDIIIEPFAGAAAYASVYFDRDVRLYDAYDKISEVWKYLISASKSDILSLPDIRTGQKVTDYNLPIGARNLIGFCINPGSSSPKVTASLRSKWPDYKKRIADFVPKIKHWKFFQQSYVSILNEPATWFIDPPYQKAGKYYFGHSKIDFNSLGTWCKERMGQVIVCENEGADWLPFQFLTSHQGSMQKNIEVVYLQDDEDNFDDLIPRRLDATDSV